MTALMSVQEQHSSANPFVAARAQALFSQMDGNGDGQVSKSEFENVFGSNADMSKVDGLFNTLDSNGDGSVSQGELTSAVQASHAHHGHHHHANSSQGGDGGMFQALMTSGTQGATADTATNSDGSSTTTISYADGSKVALTSPPGSNGGGSTGTGSGSGDSANLLERLIRLQAQSFTTSTDQKSRDEPTALEPLVPSQLRSSRESRYIDHRGGWGLHGRSWPPTALRIIAPAVAPARHAVQ